MISDKTYLRINEFFGEVPRLGNRVGADECFADHENLVWVCELAELGQRAHESRVVVSASCGVDEDYVVEHLALSGVGCVYHSIAGNGGCVFAIPLLKQIDGADLLATAELAEVANVHAELLDGARTESVCCYDKDAQLVLEEEVGDLAEVGGFADAVDAYDADNVGSCVGRLDGASDVAEKVEGRGRCEDASESFAHAFANGLVDGGERAGLLVEKVGFYALAEAHGSFSRYVLLH